jgi:cytochrome c2
VEVGDPEWGRELFEDYYQTRCDGCHSLDGSAFRAGPSLLGISKLAGDRVPELSAVEYLRQSIVDPSAYVVEDFHDLMPKGLQSLLSEEDIDNLIAFMLTQ